VIAEDEVLLALALRSQLVSRGITVVGMAKTGMEAIDLCRKEHPNAVLMDIRMPEIDGIEATRRIVAECPSCVVVVLSAMAERDARARAEEAGAKAYLTKPANIAEVVRVLGEWATGEAPS
jgi:CheY-like chemotaxis protein